MMGPRSRSVPLKVPLRPVRCPSSTFLHVALFILALLAHLTSSEGVRHRAVLSAPPVLAELQLQRPELVESYQPWWQLAQLPSRIKTRTPRLHLATFCSYPERCQRLMDSARKYRLPLLVFTAMPSSDPWISKAHALWMAAGHLARVGLAHDVLMYVDGSDTELFCSEESILRKFFSLRSPVVLGGEAWPWPERDLLWEAYAPASQWPTRFNKVQAGTFMGLAHALRAMLGTYMQGRGGPRWQDAWNCSDAAGVFHSPFDDQRCLHAFFFQNRHAVVLDYYNNLFCTKAKIPDDSLRWVPARNVWHLNETGSHPCVLHFPGATKKVIPKFTRASEPLDTSLPEFKRLAGLPEDGVNGVRYVHLTSRPDASVVHPLLAAAAKRLRRGGGRS